MPTDVAVETPAPVQDAVEVIAPAATERPEPPHPYDEPKEGDDTAPRRLSRHAAQKDRAPKSAVPQIQELSGLIRSLTPTSESDAPRVAALKAKLRAALEIDTPKIEPKPEPKAPAPVYAPASLGDFTEPEPDIKTFTNAADPYLAYTRALASWDRRKDAHDQRAKDVTAQQTAAQQDGQKAWQQVEADFSARYNTFKAARPDFEQKLATVTVPASPAMVVAIKTSQTGPEDLLHLAEHPAILDELFLLTDGKPVTEALVAIVQRRLSSSRLATVTTGAVQPAVSVRVAPRPPTPVRTAPIQTGEPSAGDDDSLEAHRARFGVGSSRRRR